MVSLVGTILGNPDAVAGLSAYMPPVAAIGSALAGIAAAGFYAYRCHEPDLLSSQLAASGGIREKMVQSYLQRNFQKDDEHLGGTCKRLTVQQIQRTPSDKLLEFFQRAKEFLEGRNIGLDPNATGVLATILLIEDELNARSVPPHQMQEITKYCKDWR